MRLLWTSLVLVFLTSSWAVAGPKRVEAPAECIHCGMDRAVYGYSRMVVTYEDGSSTGTCSINCVVVDMQKQPGKKVASFRVGDYNSRKLIDARTAVWVLGGRKRGVMTPLAKWAFADRTGAQSFIKAHGGKLATFDDVLLATEQELAAADRR
jgi:nitrous oxide reductase accessory protein NosL